VAHLNVAVDGADLFLELISPAANIVGFEHSPDTEVQEDAVEKALDKLESGEILFVLPCNAQGELAESTVETDIEQADETESHSEFRAEYHFFCENPEKLTHIDVMLLRAFPGIERIEVQLFTDRKQTALELTAKKTRIPF
jgi:hypothetical protein